MCIRVTVTIHDVATVVLRLERRCTNGPQKIIAQHVLRNITLKTNPKLDDVIAKWYTIQNDYDAVHELVKSLPRDLLSEFLEWVEHRKQMLLSNGLNN